MPIKNALSFTTKHALLEHSKPKAKCINQHLYGIL